MCYKCGIPWEPGHKKVCKAQRQINALVIGEDDNGVPQVIYTDEDFNQPAETGAPEPEPETDCQLQLFVHAATGVNVASKTFTLKVHS